MRDNAQPAGMRLREVPLLANLAPAARVPDLPPCHIERPRLYDLLDFGTEGPLTLVSAPAGGGKTTLIASWVGSGRPRHSVLWLVPEPGDRRDIWTRLAAQATEAGILDRPETGPPE